MLQDQLGYVLRSEDTKLCHNSESSPSLYIYESDKRNLKNRNIYLPKNNLF